MDIQPALVRQLIDEQFPQWSKLDIEAVARSGWDNRTFRLGEQLLVRMPSAESYAPQVQKEQRWLPYLANHLSTPIPHVVEQGEPGHGYPWVWSIYEWREGTDVESSSIVEPVKLAQSLSRFLGELHQVDSTDGPQPGLHNFFRGGSLFTYDQDTRAYIRLLSDEVCTEKTLAIWNASLQSSWTSKPVWVHGDLEPSNLLAIDGQLSAVIDFGCCAVGDPACDLVMAWTYFDEHECDIFQSSLCFDDATWNRARAWALWKALFRMSESLKARDDEFKAAKLLVEKIVSRCS